MSYGAHQYRRSEGSALSPRETEAAAFAFVNRLLAQGDNRESRMRGLVKNQQLWSLLLRDVGSSSNNLPTVLKSDVTSLGLVVIRNTISAMGSADRPVMQLIQINEDMIEALRTPVLAPATVAPAMLALAG